MRDLTLRGLVAGLVGLALLSGCGPKELAKKDTYPTHGKVTHGGEPVQFAIIRLTSSDPACAPAWGLTGADGTFTLRSFSNAEPDGAVPGEYEVHLEAYDATKAGAIPKDAKPTPLTPQMQSPGVTVVVKEEDNDLPIEIP